MQDTITPRLVEDGDCLRWRGACANGHPYVRIDGRSALVRRVLWERERGPIPAGRILRSTCGTPACVAVEHLVCTTYRAVAKECGAQGLMSGPVRSARIAAAKRAGKQAKITQADARAIRVSAEPATALAARHGLSVSTVCRIKRHECRREYGAANPFAGLGA